MGAIVARINFDERPFPPGHLLSTASDRPLLSRDGTRAIAFDGRLDNAADLRRRLALPGASDAALALAAFETWDARAPEHLIGDFVFAIRDERARRLFCARDPLGLRPLYYWSDARRFVCASDLAQILNTPGLPLEPNAGMIAEHLANAITTQDETVYAGVMRLPHGHTVEVTADGGISRRPYWSLDPHRALSCRSDAEYAEHFHELFTEAVRCRLPPDGPAAIYLSGGVDSSAVTAVASTLSAADLRPETFSLAFGNDPERDELRYIDDVCRHCGVRSHVTHASDDSDPGGLEAPCDVFEALPDRAALGWKRGIRARGFRVVLTGQGGDRGFYGSLYHYADLLRRGRMAAALGRWRDDRRVLGSGVTAKDLVISGLWPLLPPLVARVMRPLARRLGGIQPVPPWVPAPFASSVNLHDRLRPVRDAWKGGSAASWDVRRNYESGWVYMAFEAEAREAASLDLDERHPFFDRRIVEFAAALPDEQRWRGELTRFVVRRALGDRLPPSIRTRTSAGDGSRRVAQAVEQMAAAGIFDGMTAADRGWIDPVAIASMLRRMRERFAKGEAGYIADASPLWIVGGTERWLRAAFKSGYTCVDRRAGARPERSHD